MEEVFVVLIRGGYVQKSELHLVFVDNHRPEHWRIHGVYATKKKAEGVKEKLKSPLNEVRVEIWSVE